MYRLGQVATLFCFPLSDFLSHLFNEIADLLIFTFFPMKLATPSLQCSFCRNSLGNPKNRPHLVSILTNFYRQLSPYLFKTFRFAVQKESRILDIRFLREFWDQLTEVVFHD